MKSQVSFKFDGEHNTNLIISILKKRLQSVKYQVEKETRNVFRIYVASTDKKEKTFAVCYGIQCFAVYDFTRTL